VKRLGAPSRSPPAGLEPVVGTPLYISPEAITAPGGIDGRSDLYGLGAVAHYLLSGAPVFSGRSVVEVCGHQLLTPPEPLSQRVGWVIAGDLENVVLDCLQTIPRRARPLPASWLGASRSAPTRTPVSSETLPHPTLQQRTRGQPTLLQPDRTRERGGLPRRALPR
jgi:serine/threonine protein kinase